MAALALVVGLGRLRKRRDADRVGLVAVVEHPDVLDPVLLVVEHGLVEHDEQVAVGQRQAVVRAAAERRRTSRGATISFGLARSATSITTMPASRQARIGGVAVDDGMVQAEAAGARPVRRLARRLVHAGNPVATGLARLGRIAHVDGDEDVVGEAVDQRRGIGPAPAGVPDAMDAAAFDRHEADPARLGRLRDVVDRKPRGPVARGLPS